jgi:hypothetical protein
MASALSRLVLVLAALLFQAFDEVLTHAAMKLLQIRFVQVLNANQLDDVCEILVAAVCKFQPDERRQFEAIDFADQLADIAWIGESDWPRCATPRGKGRLPGHRAIRRWHDP